MSFSSPGRGAATSESGWRPPTTFVDILFLILTFFITIASFQEDDQRIDVSLPATESGKAGGARTQIIITVTAAGAIFIGDRAYQWEELRATLQDLAGQFPNESVVIRGDKESKLGPVVKIMDLCYALKLKTVYLATTKPAEEL